MSHVTIFPRETKKHRITSKTRVNRRGTKYTLVEFQYVKSNNAGQFLVHHRWVPTNLTEK